MERFSKNGRSIIPLGQRKSGTTETDERRVRYVVTEAYCPNGCNIIDREHEINGAAGLRMKFKRPGMEGQFVLSAIEGDFDKIILSGELEKGTKDELYCPHCGVTFKKLVNCSCQRDADMVVIGLTPELDFNNAISFCNVTGCANGTTIQSGEVIRHIQLYGSV
ncbi:MAG: hypothetical protein A2Z25_14685 [Planctomycetes bacterium RBG_16_55_9]|nr:MAG: hypothetical protein A2Z25_14685 [Planctomycetes bacterium RBG_16_55_9]